MQYSSLAAILRQFPQPGKSGDSCSALTDRPENRLNVRDKCWNLACYRRNGPCLLRPTGGLSQGDFRPAETHRNPGGDQLQHELAGVTTIIRQVIGKLDADAPLFCHDPHFKWRRVCRKAVPVHRQPVPFGEVEEHCRIAARGNDSSGRGSRLEPTLFKMLLPYNELHSILSIQDKARSPIGIEHGWSRSHLLEPTPSFLATSAIAGDGKDRRPCRLDLHLAALARREKEFALLLVHCALPSWAAFRRLFCR